MMWTYTTALVGLATGSIKDRRWKVIMDARRKWARENAACALVVFGTISGSLLFDSGSAHAENTTGYAEDTRSAPRSSSDQQRTTLVL
jgi:hypothetical protein